ncbi:MAG: hypothetical protein ACAH59_03905 [Pseudobdellovibrionaceae bacterium]
MKLKQAYSPLVCLLTLAIGFSSMAAEKNSLRTSYQKENKPSMSLSVEPIWLLVGGIGAKAEYFVTDRVSAGLNGVYIAEHEAETESSDSKSSSTSYRWSSYEVNIGSNIMLTGNLLSNGFYINPAIGYTGASIKNFGEMQLQGSTSSPQARLTGGYQWFSKSYPNLRLLAGAGVRMIQEPEVVVQDSTGSEIGRVKTQTLTGLALDFHIGYLF